MPKMAYSFVWWGGEEAREVGVALPGLFIDY